MTSPNRAPSGAARPRMGEATCGLQVRKAPIVETPDLPPLKLEFPDVAAPAKTPPAKTAPETKPAAKK